MLKFLSGAVTQSAADTWTVAEMATGLANATLGYRVRGFVFGLPAPVEVDSELEIIIGRRSMATAPTIADRTLLWIFNYIRDLTTSGLIDMQRYPFVPIDKDLDLLIVEDPIYIGCGSATTGLANTARVRLYYEEVRLTETAKLAALTESLNA